MSKYFLSFALMVMCAGCNTHQQVPVANDNHTAHNSRNSLHWAGIYRGTLPCADCEGIQTTVYLNKDLGYALKTKYLGKSDSIFQESGKITWNADGSQITLTPSDRGEVSYYAVGEDILTRLDMDGKPITGQLARFYTLSKSNFAIYEKYWKLIEIYGKPVTFGNISGKEPHVIFKENGRVTGNAGCNNFTGSVRIESVNRIQISRVAATQMACLNMDLERQVLDVLQKVDNYYIVGDTLILNKARMAPLARFKMTAIK